MLAVPRRAGLPRRALPAIRGVQLLAADHRAYRCCRSATRVDYRRRTVVTDRRVTLALQPYRLLHVTVACSQPRLSNEQPPMMTHVTSRLFGLTAFDWAVLLVGTTGCGVLTSLF